MDLRVLGPVEAYYQGRPLELGRRRERLLLGVLLLDVGRLVPAARLASLLWADDPPSHAHRSLQIHVSRLRGALKPAGESRIQLINRGQGYLVQTDPLFVDAHRFRGALEQARKQSQPGEVVATLREALALWRGPALMGVTSDDVRSRLTAGLAELRLSATELLYEAELRLGRHENVAPELVDLVAQHPTRERLIGLLMTAWHRQGRVRDALELYQRAWAAIIEEHGVEPGAELRGLHMSLLRDDPAPKPGPRTQYLPAQLPAQAGGFTGRDRELAQLDALAASTRDSGSPAVIAVVGSPGIGKTALVVRWAHGMSSGFPDGQLFIDMRGYDRARPVRPIEALTYLVRSLGVAPDAVPVEVDEAAALYRSVVAGRRMLVVLDNVSSVDQVRPLLPGTPECMVIVTSRDALTGLVVRQGARSLTLPALSSDESVDLLTWVIGRDLTEADLQACLDLARACGHLPLALRIAAANIAGQPRSSLARQVATFTSAERLTALHAGDDESSSVRAAFAHSFGGLADEDRHLLGMLGLFPGQDITSATAAVIGGVAPGAAGMSLDRLADAHLVAPRGDGLYSSHDLLRLFAQEQAQTDFGPQVRTDALTRLHDHYLTMLDAAARLLYPQMLRLPFEAAVRMDFADTAAAAQWLDTEHANLVATVVHAAGSGLAEVTYRLADAMRGHLWMRRDITDWLTVARCALSVAERGESPEATISATISLGHAYHCASHYREAVKAYEQALALSRKADWLQAQGTAIGNLAVIQAGAGEVRQAIELCRESIVIYQRLGHRAGEAVNLGTLGLAYLMSGALSEARDTLTKAVELHRGTGAASMLVMSLNHLGDTCRELGEFAEAQQFLDNAIELAQQVRFRSGEAVAGRYVARLHLDRGQHATGRHHAERALQVSRDTDNSFNVAYALNALGIAHQRAKRAGEAIECHTDALQIARKSAETHPEVEATVGLGAAFLLAGRLEEALEHAQSALAAAQSREYLIYETEAAMVLARTHAQRGELALAKQNAEHALTLARRTGQRLGEAAAQEFLAELPSG
ncbi:SARP family transcriptional regulator [Rhizocola hellebori]|uniref:SARP family transcriptional regulator n=1 Tax=Rhizocola hellebori TaxID=1392758 RepID=A0A8J3Q1R1_9ACTN|nr:BTAD domain-containing putative transcriptional regulator [Rhizocola hellebori]GIH02160.1 SARP family transcriptional regulator [Rhizocola hellebori]